MNEAPVPPKALALANVAVVVIDLVESVVLMQHDFQEVVARWRHLVAVVRQDVLPRHGGRLVKSLGDGLLLTFDKVPDALQAAFEVLELLPALNNDVSVDREFALRVAIHEADVLADELDIYGPGVNLAARLVPLARPNGVVLSSLARDAVSDPFFADFEDLGPNYLKHIDEPVRAFLAAPARSMARPIVPQRRSPATQSAIAVLDFEIEGPSTEAPVWGILLADELTRMLSRQSICGVVSRLSARAVGSGAIDVSVQAARLGAGFIVTGRGRVEGAGVSLDYAVSPAGVGPILRGTVRVRSEELGDADSESLNRWVAAVSAAVTGVELQRVQGLQLNALADYTLLVSGVSLMHRTSPEHVARASQTLELLVERHPRAAEARAWLAKCHVLRMANGLSSAPTSEAQRAHMHIRRALEQDPRHALALCVDGLVHLFLDRDVQAAQRRYLQALEANAHEPLAWLFLSSVHAHAGEGAKAMDCVTRARALSPVDPLTHFFDGFTAWSLLAAGQFGEARRFALRAMSANASHRPTYLTLTMAQQLDGDILGARRTAETALALMPDFSVRSYLARFPGGPNAHAERL
ncbi:MAG: hypothetical protein KF683_21890, partial [Rubrivivax sp.]|nr:hypothetical protein [Rubrivivax sp.]